MEKSYTCIWNHLDKCGGVWECKYFFFYLALGDYIKKKIKLTIHVLMTALQPYYEHKVSKNLSNHTLQTRAQLFKANDVVS